MRLVVLDKAEAYPHTPRVSALSSAATRIGGDRMTLRVLTPPRKRGIAERFLLWLFSRPDRRPW